MNFLSGPEPKETLSELSTALVAEKRNFASRGRARWFGGKHQHAIHRPGKIHFAEHRIGQPGLLKVAPQATNGRSCFCICRAALLGAAEEVRVAAGPGAGVAGVGAGQGAADSTFAREGVIDRTGACDHAAVPEVEGE
jgi:hypothetical protein